MAKSTPLVEKSGTQDVALEKKRLFRVIHGNRVDSAISNELLNNMPTEGVECVYASRCVPTFHIKGGESRVFDRLIAVTADGRPECIGGWKRTSDPDEIEALDRYCKDFSGDFRKIFPAD